MTLRSLKNIEMKIINGPSTDQELNEHFNASEIKLFGEGELEKEATISIMEMVQNAARRVRSMKPIMRYHGGKFRLAPWVMSFDPLGSVVVTCFAPEF